MDTAAVLDGTVSGIDLAPLDLPVEERLRSSLRRPARRRALARGRREQSRLDRPRRVGRARERRRLDLLPEDLLGHGRKHRAEQTGATTAPTGADTPTAAKPADTPAAAKPAAAPKRDARVPEGASWRPVSGTKDYAEITAGAHRPVREPVGQRARRHGLRRRVSRRQALPRLRRAMRSRCRPPLERLPGRAAPG